MSADLDAIRDDDGPSIITINGHDCHRGSIGYALATMIQDATTRAEAAEAEVKRLRDGIRALAHRYERSVETHLIAPRDDLRALLDGEAGA